jgi:hypothetical protein
MRILVTGGSGFIGTQLASELNGFSANSTPRVTGSAMAFAPSEQPAAARTRGCRRAEIRPEFCHLPAEHAVLPIREVWVWNAIPLGPFSAEPEHEAYGIKVSKSWTWTANEFSILRKNQPFPYLRWYCNGSATVAQRWGWGGSDPPSNLPANTNTVHFLDKTPCQPTHQSLITNHLSPITSHQQVPGESLGSGLLAEAIVDCITRNTTGSRDIGGRGGAGSSWLCCLPEYSCFS